MKSNKRIPINIRYVYLMMDAFTEMDTIQGFNDYYKEQMRNKLEAWIDDDTWLDYPKSTFMVTNLYLNMFGQPTYVELTEQGLLNE